MLQAGGDKEGSLKAYEDAVGLLDPPAESDIPLLDKALALQRTAGAAKSAAVTTQRLLTLLQDPKERASRRREAALLLEAQGEYGQAGELLEQALAENPKDEAVLASVVAAYERAKRRTELEAVLSSSLPYLEPVADDPRARSAAGEPVGEAGRAAPQEPRQQERHRGGAERGRHRQRPGQRPGRCWPTLYGDKADYAEAALDNRRKLVAADVTHAESLRTLARATPAEGRVDWARCFFEALELFGLAEKKDRAFLAAHPPPARKPEDPYASSHRGGRPRQLPGPPRGAGDERGVRHHVGGRARHRRAIDREPGPHPAGQGLAHLRRGHRARSSPRCPRRWATGEASLYVSPQAGAAGIRVLVPGAARHRGRPAAGRQRPQPSCAS